MEDYRFIEGELPSTYRYNFAPALFNRPDYRSLHSSGGWLSYSILNDTELSVEAQIHFFLEGQVAKSNVRSPFGGIEVSRSLSYRTLFNFIDFICTHLEQRGVNEVVITNPPNQYDVENLSRIEVSLLNQYFTIATAELASIISVTRKDFGDIIHERKARKLIQTKANADLAFRKLDQHAVGDVYALIEKHRKEKNYPLSISYDHLVLSMRTMPNAYTLFGVYHKQTLVAASVCVRVRPDILYHFISDHDRKIGDARPALLLMEGIYRYCQQENIKMLDLGTSALEGLPNFKLIKFKGEIGGVACTKFTFKKQL